jgi:hypothetical protein
MLDDWYFFSGRDPYFEGIELPPIRIGFGEAHIRRAYVSTIPVP